jgi:hypothetical protein
MVRYLPLGLIVVVAAGACRRDAAVQPRPVPVRRAPRTASAMPALPSPQESGPVGDLEERLQQDRTRIARLLRDQGDLTARMTEALRRAEERVMELEAQLDVLETVHVEQVLERATKY